MTIANAIPVSPSGLALGAQPPQPALACNSAAISTPERARYNGLMRKIKSAVRHQHHLPDGYAWQLDGAVATMPEVAEWMSMERRCCPFLTLQLEAAGGGMDFAVKLTGPDGVKAFLGSEFGIGN